MKCPLSLASRQKLARRAVFGGHGDGIQGNSLLGYLKSEVHVGTACVGVGVLVRWCEVVGEGEQIPSSLVEHIKVRESSLNFDSKIYSLLSPLSPVCLLRQNCSVSASGLPPLSPCSLWLKGPHGLPPAPVPAPPPGLSGEGSWQVSPGSRPGRGIGCHPRSP